MPNIKSAKKRAKTNKRDELKNRTAKAALKTTLKKTNAAVAAGAEDAAKQVSSTQGLIARTWKRGIIHKNKAARLQSRLMRQTPEAATEK